MLFEVVIRKIIKACELFLILTVYLFYTFSYTETIMKSHPLLIPIYLYILTLSFFYYNTLLKKSPGSLNGYTCLQIRGVCYVCNRLQNDRTFHCDSCNKCYYKRDHHCPWIGKCVAEDNYKDFYLFICFLTMYLGLRMFRRKCYVNISFISNYLFLILGLFFVYVNFLLCSDITSVEYGKSFARMRYFRCKEVWTLKQMKKMGVKVKIRIMDDSWWSLLYILIPVLGQSADISDDE